MNLSLETLLSAIRKVALIALCVIGGLVSMVFAGVVIYAAVTNIVAAALLVALAVAQIADTIRLRGDPKLERDRRGTWWI